MKILFESKKKLTIWLLGNITIDSKIFREQDKINPILSTGGAVTFGSITIKKFFSNIRIKIFSVGLPEDISLFDDISLVNLSTEQSKLTYFGLNYLKNTRNFILNYFPIGTIHVPEDSIDNDPDIIFILPVFHEIQQSTVVDLRNKYPDSFIVLDPQGWFRKKSKKNIIEQKKWTPEKNLLESINFMKFSSEDLRYYSRNNLIDFLDDFLKNDVMVAITGGRRGSILIQSKLSTVLYCSSVFTENVKDTTGAGDIWITIFGLIYYLKGNIKFSIASSSVISSFFVQAEGLNYKSDEKDIITSINKHIKSIEVVSLEQGIDKIFTMFPS